MYDVLNKCLRKIFMVLMIASLLSPLSFLYQGVVGEVEDVSAATSWSRPPSPLNPPPPVYVPSRPLTPQGPDVALNDPNEKDPPPEESDTQTCYCSNGRSISCDRSSSCSTCCERATSAGGGSTTTCGAGQTLINNFCYDDNAQALCEATGGKFEFVRGDANGRCVGGNPSTTPSTTGGQPSTGGGQPSTGGGGGSSCDAGAGTSSCGDCSDAVRRRCKASGNIWREHDNASGQNCVCVTDKPLHDGGGDYTPGLGAGPGTQQECIAAGKKWSSTDKVCYWNVNWDYTNNCMVGSASCGSTTGGGILSWPEFPTSTTAYGTAIESCANSGGVYMFGKCVKDYESGDKIFGKEGKTRILFMGVPYDLSAVENQGLGIQIFSYGDEGFPSYPYDQVLTPMEVQPASLGGSCGTFAIQTWTRSHLINAEFDDCKGNLTQTTKQIPVKKVYNRTCYFSCKDVDGEEVKSMTCDYWKPNFASDAQILSRACAKLGDGTTTAYFEGESPSDARLAGNFDNLSYPGLEKDNLVKDFLAAVSGKAYALNDPYSTQELASAEIQNKCPVRGGKGLQNDGWVNGRLDYTCEECDDGKPGSDMCYGAGDGWQFAGMKKPATCGDGIIQSGEMCDDGDTNDTGECNKTCTSLTYCGDGTVQDPNGQQKLKEECDDGNTEDGDGCDGQCKPENASEWTED